MDSLAKSDVELLSGIESSELFKKAFAALPAREKKRWGKERFDRICAAKARGVRESKIAYEVFNWADEDLLRHKKEPPAIAAKFRDILQIPEVTDYVKAISEDDTPSWSEYMHELRVDAQATLTTVLKNGAQADAPNRAAIDLAWKVAEQELGKPIEQHKHTHEIGDNFRKAIGDAANRIAGELSDKLGTETPYTVIDAEISDLGDGEPPSREES